MSDFPGQLMSLLNDEDVQRCIHWLPSGRAFTISKPELFVNTVLKMHFNSVQFESFVVRLKSKYSHIATKRTLCFKLKTGECLLISLQNGDLRGWARRSTIDTFHTHLRLHCSVGTNLISVIQWGSSKVIRDLKKNWFTCLMQWRSQQQCLLVTRMYHRSPQSNKRKCHHGRIPRRSLWHPPGGSMFHFPRSIICLNLHASICHWKIDTIGSALAPCIIRKTCKNPIVNIVGRHGQL